MRFTILSSAIGSLSNPEKLSATFQTVKKKKISNSTIKRYIDYLCDSFLIDSAIRYDVKGKKYIDTPAPYYNESGVLIMSVYDFLLNENSLEN